MNVSNLIQKKWKDVFLLLLVSAISVLLDIISFASISPVVMEFSGEEQYLFSDVFLNFYLSVSEFVPINKIELFALASFLFVSLSVIFRFYSLSFLNYFVEKVRIELTESILLAISEKNFIELSALKKTDYVKALITDLDIYVEKIHRPVIAMLVHAVVVIIMLITMGLINIQITIIGGVGFVVIYGSVYLLSRRVIQKYGSTASQSNGERLALVEEAFADYRYLVASQKDKLWFDSIIRMSSDFSKVNAKYASFNQGVSYFVEGGFLISIIGFVLYSNSALGGSIVDISETLVFMFVVYRLKPSAQNIFNGINALKYSVGFVYSNVAKDLPVGRAYDRFQNLPNASFQTGSRPVNLQIQDVSYSFGEYEVFAGLSFEVGAGDFIIIKGESGVGKTTLVNLLLGNYEPTKGEVLYNGINATKLQDKQKYFSYVPQQPTILDRGLRENIEFNAYISECIATDYEIDRLLEMVGLGEMSQQLREMHSLKNLSGGQAQRIVLARALLGRKNLIILDEPSSALDERNERMIFDLLKSEAKRGRSVVVITHNTSLIDYATKAYELTNKKLQRWAA